MNAELNTTKITEEQLEDWAGEFSTCNGFAFDYLESHENAVVKDAMVNGKFHCYVYDRYLDVTIDPTLGQFEELPTVGAWDGDTHPYTDDEEIYQWDDKDAFTDEYSQPNSPYIV